MPPKKTAKRRSRKEILQEDLTNLICAYNTNDEEVFPILKEALSEGVDVNLIINTSSLICYFAFFGMLRCFEECFLLGADPTIVTSDDPSDTLVSAVWGIAPAAASLRMVVSLSNHAKFNDLDQKEAVERACENFRFEVVRLLLRRNNSFADIVLRHGLWQGSLELVEVALAFSARVDQQCTDGRYLIHMAAELQDSSILQKLLDAGADIEAEHESTSETPFEVAVRCNSVNCVKFLIARKCEASIGEALLLGIRNRSHDVLSELLRNEDMCKEAKKESLTLVFRAAARDDLTAFRIIYPILYPISKFCNYFISRLVRSGKYDMLSAALFEFEHPGLSIQHLTQLLAEAPNDDFKALLQRKIDAMNGVDLVSKVKKEVEEEEQLQSTCRTKKKRTTKTTTKSKKK